MLRRSGYGHMVLDSLIERGQALRKSREARREAISSRRQAEEYRERAAEIVARSFQPMPPRTPLNPVVANVISRDGYRIEKVLFESRPKCLVTANLYLPENSRRPCPAVLSPCGHSMIGKGEPKYQEACQRLALAGFAVLIYDPLCQGERDQFHHLPARSLARRSCVLAHNLLGKQLELLGEWVWGHGGHGTASGLSTTSLVVQRLTPRASASQATPAAAR